MRFELLNELGRGGTGVVYKARDNETGDIVAVKQLRPDAGFTEREVLLARKVTHPNVCRVYELFREQGRAWISMEFVEGENLGSLLRRVDALPLDQASDIACQILDGLEAVHKQGIVHRDLKPENILIARDGTVKLADFGIAAPAESGGGNTVSGSPLYMAPEQISGDAASTRSDIYALGLILYNMISGIHDTPRHIEAAIARCLERDPAKRFGSVAEIRAALVPVKRQRIVMMPAVVILIFAFLLAGGVWLRPSAGTVPLPQKPAAPPPPPADVMLHSVAVIRFEGDRDGSVTNAVMAALTRTHKFRVVERTEVERLLKEPQRGAIIGAEYMFFGTHHLVDSHQFQLTIRLVRTETSEVPCVDSLFGAPGSEQTLIEKVAANCANSIN